MTSSSASPRTYTYKTVEAKLSTLDIPLDVYLPASRHAAPPKPLLWVHTGGFLQGTRKFLPAHLIRACDRLNLALIAPDFRLAPQVTIADVLEDVADAIRFTLRSDDGLEARLSADDAPTLDTSSYVLAGSSAGGWAALLLGLGLVTGFPALPPPLAALAIYPITTVDEARAPYFHAPIKPLPVAYSPQAKVGDLVPAQPLKPHLDPSSAVLTEAAPTVLPSRAPLYNYARQEGLYPGLVLGTGHSSLKPEAYCTPSLINTHITSASPASSLPKLVYVAYGDADLNVEVDQSAQTIKALRDSGAPFNVGAHVEHGKGHLWDIFDQNVDIPTLWKAVEQVL